jgi:hypothetical protein
MCNITKTGNNITYWDTGSNSDNFVYNEKDIIYSESSSTYIKDRYVITSTEDIEE